MPQDDSRNASLPLQGAFVVQFYADTDLAAGRVGGRVEHVLSGQVQHFYELEALLAFIAHVLRQGDTASPGETGSHGTPGNAGRNAC